MRIKFHSPDTTTAAVPAGKCADCGWQLFIGISHHCPTSVRPLVLFNNVNAPRVHSSGGLNDNERHLKIDERYS